ncbi:MAG: hypothetical protein ACYCW6_02390 [Candidatus Xenobia bacterium]
MNVSATSLGQRPSAHTTGSNLQPIVLDAYLPSGASDGDKQQRIANLTNMIYTWTNQVQSLQSQRSNLQGNIATWQSQREAQQERSNNLGSQMSDIDSRLGDLQMDKQGVMERLEDAKGEERQELESRRFDLDNRIDSLQSQRGNDYYAKADADAQVSNLGQQIDGAQSQISGIDDQLSNLNSQLSQAQAELSQLRGW